MVKQINLPHRGVEIFDPEWRKTGNNLTEKIEKKSRKKQHKDESIGSY